MQLQPESTSKTTNNAKQQQQQQQQLYLYPTKIEIVTLVINNLPSVLPEDSFKKLYWNIIILLKISFSQDFVLGKQLHILFAMCSKECA